MPDRDSEMNQSILQFTTLQSSTSAYKHLYSTRLLVRSLLHSVSQIYGSALSSNAIENEMMEYFIMQNSLSPSLCVCPTSLPLCLSQ